LLADFSEDKSSSMEAPVSLMKYHATIKTNHGKIVGNHKITFVIEALQTAWFFCNVNSRSLTSISFTRLAIIFVSSFLNNNNNKKRIMKYGKYFYQTFANLFTRI
jgi:hypothetical protein